MPIVLDGTNGITTPPVVLNALALSTPVPGELEYDGRVPYFTPAGTQRGVIPGMQYYRLNSAVVGSNATGAQNTFGVGCTLSGSTVYEFESVFVLTKSAGVSSHTISLGFGGTATVNNIGYLSLSLGGTNQSDVPYTGTLFSKWIITSSLDVITTGVTAQTNTRWVTLKGTVSVGSSGTFIPQYSLSAAPGGAYTTGIGSYFLIYPISAAGNNSSVGTWA